MQQILPMGTVGEERIWTASAAFAGILITVDSGQGCSSGTVLVVLLGKISIIVIH